MWTPSVPQPVVKADKKTDKGDKRPSGKLGKSGKPAKKKSRWWVRLIKWTLITGFVMLLTTFGTAAFVFWYYSRDKTLPDPSSLSEIQHRQVTWIVDRNDQRIGVVYGEPKVCVKKKGAAKTEAEPPPASTPIGDDRVDEAVETIRKQTCESDSDCDKASECKPAEHETRTFVPYEKIPKTLIDALIATEDASFWDHSGVDYMGMVRAFWANLRAGKAKQGASTITQQVVKNLLLTPEKSFKRKIQEVIIARRLEKVLTKEEILTLYLNQVNFGNARYGVAEAARFYFGKEADKLDVGECAMLAGLPQSPEALAPNRKRSQAAAKARQVHVLNRLAEMSETNPAQLRGKPLSRADAQKWIDAPVKIVEAPFPYLNTAPEWERRVREELLADKCGGKQTCPEGELYLDTLGATIRTTLDPKVQEDAQHALQVGLRGVDKRHGYGRVKRSLKSDKAADELRKKLSRVTPESGLVKGETYEAIVTAVHDADRELEVDLGSFKAAVIVDDDRYMPLDEAGKVLALSTRFKTNDVVDVVWHPDAAKKPTKHAKHRVAFPQGPQGAVVVLEVKTRKVRALVGGYSIKRGGLNRATDSKRQPGSSFKPYVMAAGIKLGAGKEVDQAGHIMYTPASLVIDAPDPDDRLGYKRWLPKNYESGNFEGPVLLRHALAKSINTVAIRIYNKITPTRILDLTTAVGLDTSKFPTSPALALGAGEVTLLDHTNALTTFAAGGKTAKPVFIDAINGKATEGAVMKQVVEPEVAYVTVDMMRSVVTSGTGAGAAKLGIPVAGKTGTSNDAKDVWFIGLTPDYAVGVWIGHDEPKSMGRETGGGTAVPVFVDVVKSLKLPAKPFPRPPKVIDLKIDRETGLKAPDGWPKEKTMTEVFVEGTAPTEEATAEGNDVKDEYNE